MPSQTVLVTGAAGFIGSHLVEALLKRGDRVVGVDNFDPYYDPATKHQNLRSALAHPRFTLAVCDIRNGWGLESAFGAQRVDAVVHLAARAGVRPSLAEPALYCDVNVGGTMAVLEAIRRHGVPHLVFGSSSSVYGANSVPPFHEDQPADQPSSPYAATKRADELICHSHHHLYGTSVSSLRFFTVYGPRQRPEMAIHAFTRRIDCGEPVPVFGSGRSRRDYTYVSDIVAGIVAAIDRPRGFRVYNLGTTATIGLNDLVQMLGERLGREVVFDHRPDEPGDVPITHADISRATAELGYRPRVPLADGLDSFVAWYRSETATLESTAA